jgi:hypothetical protein
MQKSIRFLNKKIYDIFTCFAGMQTQKDFTGTTTH